MAKGKDYYSILEVSPRARSEVIAAAYEELRNICQDGTDDGNRKLVEVEEAYHCLIDSNKREKYDYQREHLEGTLIGDYKVLSEIATGGFGTTYKGDHILTGELVCIKHCSRISPQDEAILINEAKAMWDLRHYSMPAVRNLVKLDDQSLALVMSYIPGPTLEQVIEKLGALDPEHVCWIAERLLNALKYIHMNGVIHGDLKPQNIIIQPKSHTVVMVDFGLSMIKPTAGSDCKGYTKYFASPEQIESFQRKNIKPLIPESDFYSLAMTLIYALGGGLKHVEKKIVPEDTPGSLCEFLVRCINPDITKRPSWEKEDLCDTIRDLRIKAFGRASTQMKPIKGLV